MTGVVVFILILSFLVIIHELGHFIVARIFKIKVEEFGLGYPPRAHTLFRAWGSDFTLNWIPFGGFVRMEGEDLQESPSSATPTANERQKEGPFYQKSVAARLAVILAGACVNFMFGAVAFSVVFSLSGIPRHSTLPIIAAVSPGSPAAAAGIKPQMAITGIISSSGRVETRTYQDVVAQVQANQGQRVVLQLRGPCQQDVCPENVLEQEVELRSLGETPAGEGLLGVSFENQFLSFYPWYEMPFRGAWFGIQQAVLLGWAILQALGDMLYSLVIKGVPPSGVAGPVGIVHEASSSGILTRGPLSILLFAGMLSINLAIMNVLPIPALDGGRAVFIILELLAGKRRLLQKIEGYANYGGYFLLLGLILLVTARDIYTIFVGG